MEKFQKIRYLNFVRWEIVGNLIETSLQTDETDPWPVSDQFKDLFKFVTNWSLPVSN